MLNKILEEAESRVLALIRRYDSLNINERLAIYSTTEFFKEVRDKGYEFLSQSLERDYSRILKETQVLAREYEIFPNPERMRDLDVLTKMDARMFLGESSAYASRLQKALFMGSLFGERTENIITRIEGQFPTLNRNELSIAYDTASAQFREASKAEMFYEDNFRWNLTGLNDHKTRCECRAVLNNQPKSGWTIKEINDGAATEIVKEHCPKVKPESQIYDWIGRGGYNCRHTWDIAV